MPRRPAIVFHLDEVNLQVAPGRSAHVFGWMINPAAPAMPVIRGQNGQTAILAVCGLPRPDVAVAYPTAAAAALSGFRLEWPCALTCDRMRLEWCDDSGNWHEFWREPDAINSHSTPSRARPRLLTAEQSISLYTRIRAELRHRPGTPTFAAMAGLITECTTEVTRFTPPAEWLIELDAPAGQTFSGHHIPLQGWILHPRKRVRRLFAHAEPGGSVYTIFPRQRADVVGAIPAFSASAACGFAGMIRLSAELPPRFELRVYVEADDGEIILAIVRHYLREPSAARPTLGLAASVIFARAALQHGFRPASWRNVLPRFAARPRGSDAAVPARVSVRPAPAAQPSLGLDSDDPFSSDPLISILVPVFNPPEPYLREMMASVLAQSYRRWELCLADDASTAPHVRQVLDEYARLDVRIRPVYRATNGHIARASNTALAEARGEWVALLDHDDLLPSDALHHIVAAMRTAPAGEFFYTNRDKVDDSGRHFDAEQRGEWNPAMAMTHNYLHHLTVIKRQLVVAAGAFRPDYFGSQDLDLYLRCHERLQASQIVHVPVIGYHWRAHAGSTASRGDQKDYMFDSAQRSIVDAMARRHLRARPFLPAFGQFYGMNLHQLRWEDDVLREQGVTLVVAVHESTSARRCFEALLATTADAPVHVVAVASGEIDRATPPGGLPVEWINVPATTPAAERFNLGAARARAPLLLFLDASVRPVSRGWLEDLAGWLSVPGVAAAGPKIQTPDGVLSSAGWTIDHATSLPRPLFTGDAIADLIPPFLSHSARDAWVLDPRGVLIRTAIFRELGGFDARSFPRQHFLADFCFRLRDHGHRGVFSPQAVLETLTPGMLAPGVGESGEAEDRRFIQRHPARRDPWIPAGASPTASNTRATWMPAETVTFAEGWFHLEEPQSQEIIRAGHQILGGWCLTRRGESLLELRATVAGQLRHADYGHPRPDLARIGGFADAEFFPVGFSLVLDLPAGRHSLRFEGFLAGLGWRPIAEVTLDVNGQPAASRPVGPTPWSRAHFQKSIETWLLSDAANACSDLAASAVRWVDPLAQLCNARHAALPFFGFIDQPAGDVVPSYNEVTVSGWLLHSSQPVRRVAASFNPAHWLDLNYGTESRSIVARFPERPDARYCSFYGPVTVPAHRPGPLTLRVWAQLEDATWYLAFALRCEVRDQPLVDRATSAGFRTTQLLRATYRFHRACRRRGLVGPGFWSLGKVLHGLRQQLPPPVAITASLPSAPTPLRALPPTPHVVLVTHNLNREGAPLFLLEFAGFCRSRLACNFTLVSTEEGELRREFEALDIPVTVISRQQLWTARSVAETDAALVAMTTALGATATSLVIANTIESFWAVDAAAKLGYRSLFYIHEPGVLGVHYLAHLPAFLRRAAAATLDRATCVSFLSDSSQIYYRAYCHGSNHRLQPGWTNRPAGAAVPSATEKKRARQKLGYAPNDRLILSVGTLCPRKGQLFLIEAMAELGRSAPQLAAQCRLVLVGTHDNAYGERVAALARRSGPGHVDLVPSTPHVQDYYHAADLFVMSSFEEGFSRVILEAMEFGLPIVSTDIHSVGQIARPWRESLLVRPADAHALSAAMRRLLEDTELSGRLGRQAHERLSATFTAERVLPGHLATLLEIAPELRRVEPATNDDPACLGPRGGVSGVPARSIFH